MKILTVISVALLLAFAGAEVEGTKLSVVLSPAQPTPKEVPPGSADVSGGMFRFSTNVDIEEAVITITTASATDIRDIFNPRIMFGSTRLDWVCCLDPSVGATLRIGPLSANSSTDFELRYDVSGSAAGGAICQLGVASVTVPNQEVEIVGTFPLWGNVVTVGEYFPPLMSPSVWLGGSSLTAPAETTYVYMGLTSGNPQTYISATVFVVSDPLVPVLYAKGGYLPDDWMIAQTVSGVVLAVSMAGTTPLEPGAPAFIIFAFNTSRMRLGNASEFNIKVRFNEEPEQSINGKITFAGLLGDVTVNGEVSVLDAAAILRYSVGIKDAYNGLILPIADVSGNGEITAYDASLILQFVVGVIPAFPRQIEKIQQEIEDLIGQAEEAMGQGKVVASEPIVTKGRTRIELGKYVVPILISQPAMAGEFEIGPVDGSVEVAPGEIIKGATFIANRIGNKIKVAFAVSGLPADGGELLLVKFDFEPKPFTIKARINEDLVQTLSTAVEAKSWGMIKSTFLK